MLFHTLLSLAVLTLPSVSAVPRVVGKTYEYGRSIEYAPRRRQNAQKDRQDALVEAIPYNGSIPLRLEIRDLQKNHEQWTLYILALSWMQWMNQTDPSSWYSITGIHGAPNADYGGVKALPGNGNNGYCSHVSNLFPTWHRPYLVLFERVLYDLVQMIASWYPSDRHEAFQKAAENFRIPYWDWAAKPPGGEHVFPIKITGSPRIEVDGPNGKQNISNPLFSYTFKPLDPSIFEEFPFMYWHETKRRPVPLQGINATSNNSWVAQSFDNHLPVLQQRLYNLFSNYGNYSTWSNEGWINDQNNSTADSIESLHDTVHLTTGGNFGHMAIIAYSAFDPVFFLHHANLDRLFAMWQLVYNSSYVEPMAAILPTRTISTGDIQDVHTDLTPFYFNETSFWNSDQVQDHKVFGYSYADVVEGNRTELIAAINRLYTDFSPATMNISQLSRDTGPNAVLRETPASGHTSTRAILTNGEYREWIVNVQVNKHALDASFSIYLFLGVIPDASSEWEFVKDMVGSLGIWAGHHAQAGAGSLQVSGTIPLTSALADRVSDGDLGGLDARHVEPFLTQNLGFRIAQNNGSAVDPGEVAGLSISVMSSLVEAPRTVGELARWGQVISHLDLY